LRHRHIATWSASNLLLDPLCFDVLFVKARFLNRHVHERRPAIGKPTTGGFAKEYKLQHRYSFVIGLNCGSRRGNRPLCDSDIFWHREYSLMLFSRSKFTCEPCAMELPFPGFGNYGPDDHCVTDLLSVRILWDTALHCISAFVSSRLPRPIPPSGYAHTALH
jgi:hypothetical protein